MGKLEASVAMLALALVLGLVSGGNFYDECDATWEPQNCWTYDGGNSLSLALVSNSSGSMIRSKRQFIYGTVSTMIQLVKGDSAGTVTTYYTSSVGDDHDEIDFEFLGNETGQPYTLHTNVYAAGVGDKEMQFRPWFDPTDGYHNYTISWTPCTIAWYVDGTPIRAFRNYEHTHGVAFPTSRPMYAYSSIWAAEDWATQGGRVRADWTRAPFVASYRGIDLDVCECYGGDCVYTCAGAFGGCGGLTGEQRGKMRWVQHNYRIYDYCADREGSKVPGIECTLPQY
ncbi:unnamed protein product [Triticum aestivum]|uniref:Xyloglucan endotransglucosylase/hydrolase n=2 Tax=Triticum aestivum TaxID=4565 RepID=A0A9R1JDT1_WHEAT|nr:xyloglucan endotransglucosylase/hydrolase protein 15-like [Triticum aestivum]KAF7013825.1 hypothetical protein CFC21_027875 [Triticum aestivum]SPT16138.1 unnamed protein product [Triticum aestivum]